MDWNYSNVHRDVRYGWSADKLGYGLTVMAKQWLYVVHEGGDLELPLFVGTVGEITLHYKIGKTAVTNAEQRGTRICKAGGYVSKVCQIER